MHYWQRREAVEKWLLSAESTSIGVSQGLILGPLLSLIFINDLCSVERRSKVCLFADDTTVYASSKSGDDVLRTIKGDLDSINKWFSFNHLAKNWKKMKAMVFNRYEIVLNFVLEVIGQSIEFVRLFKLMGDLKAKIWSAHFGSMQENQQ